MEYRFNAEKLAPIDPEDPRQPLVLVACGSFSPMTFLHMRMFEMAKDQIEASRRYQLLGGFVSPVSDAYRKPGLVEAKHRVTMCELGLKHSTWINVDRWESLQVEFQRTAVVLDHFQEMMDKTVGSERRVRIMLLAGGDLIESFQVPGLWAVDDLHHILGTYGCWVLERTGSDTHSFLLENDILYQHRRNVHIVKQLIHNDISSTKVRLFVKRGFSIRYLLPDSVIDYIYEHGLFRDVMVDSKM